MISAFGVEHNISKGISPGKLKALTRAQRMTYASTKYRPITTKAPTRAQRTAEYASSKLAARAQGPNAQDHAKHARRLLDDLNYKRRARTLP
jgi:hypothetical protein